VYRDCLRNELLVAKRQVELEALQMNLNGVRAIITGGASGLGSATAELFAVNGAKVTIFDLNPDVGEALAKTIGGASAKVDVTSEQDVTAGLEPR
jgi:NAD(P)-dependent dehydrogenase (short-subunit alcohol dehydrogenase family)